MYNIIGHSVLCIFIFHDIVYNNMFDDHTGTPISFDDML